MAGSSLQADRTSLKGFGNTTTSNNPTIPQSRHEDMLYINPISADLIPFLFFLFPEIKHFLLWMF